MRFLSRFGVPFATIVLAVACAPTAEPPPPATAPAAPTGPYVVMPIVAVDAPLFASERHAIQEKVLALITAQGATVVGLADLDAMAAPEPTCRDPRTVTERAIAKYGRAPQVETRAVCTHLEGAPRECTLELTIERPPATFGAATETMDRFVAKVDAPESGAGWLAALDKLGPAPANGPGGLLARLSTSASTTRIDAAEAFGGWTRAPAPATFDVARCFEDGSPRVLSDRVVLDVAADGSVRRCEATLDEFRPRGPRASCLCDAVRSTRFDAGPEGRRIALDVRSDPHAIIDAGPVRFDARIQRVRASDGGETPRVEAATQRLASCAAAARVVSPLTMRFRLDVDPSGTVTKVAMDGTNDVLRVCAGATLRGVPLRCGRAGAYSVDGELVVWSQAAVNHTP